MRRLSPVAVAVALLAAACGRSAPGRGGPGDGGAGTDGKAVVSEPWITYGHDAARTFASAGSIAGPLAMVWRYVPAPPSGRTTNFVLHAIADVDGVYLQWSASNAPYLGTTAVDRVSTDGTRVWTFDSGTDTNLGNWATLALGYVVVEDDGVYYLDPATGAKMHTTGVDWWGQTAPDPARLYLANAWHVDGPGIFVGALDGTTATVWQQSQYGKCRIDSGDLMGGIAVDGGTLFYAPQYVTGSGVVLPFTSGVYAFDGATGAPHWNVKTVPASALSAGGGHVYLIENGSQLVARNQSDGSVAWSQAVSAPGDQAPVLAAGLAIVATGAGVEAFQAASGMPAWTAPAVSAVGQPYAITFTGGCAGPLAGGDARGTTLAAALGSGTLVATASDGVHVLTLATGADLWHGAITGASGTLHDPVIVGSTVYAVDSGGLLALR